MGASAAVDPNDQNLQVYSLVLKWYTRGSSEVILSAVSCHHPGRFAASEFTSG
jgi:hypothetical protein